jgi:hypothetical protein
MLGLLASSSESSNSCSGSNGLDQAGAWVGVQTAAAAAAPDYSEPLSGTNSRISATTTLTHQTSAIHQTRTESCHSGLNFFAVDAHNPAQIICRCLVLVVLSALPFAVVNGLKSFTQSHKVRANTCACSSDCDLLSGGGATDGCRSLQLLFVNDPLLCAALPN